MSISQDGRANKLLMRFSACTLDLDAKKGVMGSAAVEGGETIENIALTMEQVILKFCTKGLGGPGPFEVDHDLFDHM